MRRRTPGVRAAERRWLGVMRMLALRHGGTSGRLDRAPSAPLGHRSVGDTEQAEELAEQRGCTCARGNW